ncbi:MAG: PaaI family thioesterase [Paracoccaceae bacterium]
MTPKMNKDDLNRFLVRAFEQVADQFHVEDVAASQVTVRLRVDQTHLRPGGTISGPSMFSLADVAMYLATLAMIGPKALAVTTNCSIDFMRKPDASRDLIAKAQIHKLGRQLSVGDVLIYSEGAQDPVARAGLTYAIPPTGSAADVST